MFHSISYKRTKKTDDSIVELESGEFARIIEILEDNDQCILRLSLIHVFCDNPFSEVVHIKKIRCEDNPDKCFTVSILNVKRKVLLVSVTTARYLCILPNTVEIQWKVFIKYIIVLFINNLLIVIFKINAIYSIYTCSL